MDINLQLSINITQRRAETGISRETLREILGIWPPHMAGVEKGTKPLTAVSFFRASRAWGESSYYFLNDITTDQPSPQAMVRNFSEVNRHILGSYEELSPAKREEARDQMRVRATPIIKAHIGVQFEKFCGLHGAQHVGAFLDVSPEQVLEYGNARSYLKVHQLVALSQQFDASVEYFFDGLSDDPLPPLAPGADLAARSFLVDANIIRLGQKLMAAAAA